MLVERQILKSANEIFKKGRSEERLYHIRMGRHLGLKSCFTHFLTHLSLWISEAFVAKIKRDYVYTSDCSDALTVMKLFKKWIGDYNNAAPHSGLGMKSPLEYRKLVNQAV